MMPRFVPQASEVICKANLNQLYRPKFYFPCNLTDGITMDLSQRANYPHTVTTKFCQVVSNNVYHQDQPYPWDTCTAPRDLLLMRAQGAAIHSRLPMGNHQPYPIILHRRHKQQASFSILSPERRYERPKLRLIIDENTNFSQNTERCDILSIMSKSETDTKRNMQNVVHYYQCHLMDCNRKFKRKTDLERHYQSVHSSRRDWGCIYCSRNFARKDSLRR